ncbi:hypothetical protein [Paracraurococcus lichenis]|uniref:Uncharacterized protein n=1 Tax=Paracraurococcus lichenis TaxID=3064888 RepID=A0ABT9E751_9PROT|nr:hypothetical protein [Paracraurococcus sp. LOR1-02]MDO9711993.1 hypothetical protein [Paracraurococcus sp. LOR1-02]
MAAADKRIVKAPRTPKVPSFRIPKVEQDFYASDERVQSAQATLKRTLAAVTGETDSQTLLKLERDLDSFMIPMTDPRELKFWGHLRNAVARCDGALQAHQGSELFSGDPKISTVNKARLVQVRKAVKRLVNLYGLKAGRDILL